jgi:hypothetical protein
MRPTRPWHALLLLLLLYLLLLLLQLVQAPQQAAQLLWAKGRQLLQCSSS